MEDSIGIDISKDRLDAFRLGDGAHRSFDNSRAGFRKLRRWLGQTPPARVVYQPTTAWQGMFTCPRRGPYHGAFERACAGHLPLVNPLGDASIACRAASEPAAGAPLCPGPRDTGPGPTPSPLGRFVSQIACRAMDARIPALMGDAFELEPDLPVSENQRELKELQVQRSALVKDRTRLMNRLRTQTLALTRRQTRARLTQVERQLAAIEAEITARLGPDRARELDILHSLPGIGPVAVAAILIAPLVTLRRNALPGSDAPRSAHWDESRSPALPASPR